MNFWSNDDIPKHLKSFFKPAPQLGLEKTPEEYVAKLVEMFREARRVLRDDGTLWMNLGDTYAANRGYQVPDSKHIDVGNSQPMKAASFGLKPKDLVGIPWMVAFALRADGWYLRQDLIWHKPNPMPESVRDRCTKAHEYLFLLSKSERYYFDTDAIQEQAIGKCHHDLTGPGYSAPGQPVNTGNRKALRSDIESRHRASIQGGQTLQLQPDGKRNKRSVWSVATAPFSGAHFATFPPDLIEPCILAGCPEGGVVGDMFTGSGTTGMVALKHFRRFVGIELNQTYANEIAIPRLEAEACRPKQMQII